MTKASEVTVTREEVRAFVEAAGLVRVRGDVQAALAAFLAPRLAAERERCAKVADTVPIETYASPPYIAQAKQVRLTVAAAIRALGDE